MLMKLDKRKFHVTANDYADTEHTHIMFALHERRIF